MKLTKILFILITALLALKNYPAEENIQKKQKKRSLAETEIKGLDEEVENNEEKKQKSDDQTQFFLISTEGERFEIPLSIAKKSNLIKNKINYAITTANYVDKSYELHTGISSYYLNILLNVLNSLNDYETVNKQLFDDIQEAYLKFDDSIVEQYCNYLTIPEIFEFFKIAYYWDFEILELLFLDLLAQQLLDKDNALNQNNLELISDLFINFGLISEWYLVEKFYYLRSSNKKPKMNDLLINFNNQLQNAFKINELNTLKKVCKSIIKQFQIDINILLDYDKIDINNRELNLSDYYIVSLNGLKRIPFIFNVKILNLKNNLIKRIDNHFNELDKLINLNLSNNLLTDISSTLNDLDSLLYLNLSKNQINNINDSFKNLTKLYHLNLSFNRIFNLDALASLKKDQLVRLDLSHNLIQNIGNCLYGFNKLKSLNLSDNRITDLLNSLKDLEGLDILYLKNNNLTQVNSLNYTHNLDLAALFLDDNQIEDITPIEQLVMNLKEFSIDNNPLNPASVELFNNFIAIPIESDEE